MREPRTDDEVRAEGKLQLDRRGVLRAGLIGTGSMLGLARSGRSDPAKQSGRSFAETGGYGSPSKFERTMRIKGSGGTGLVGGSLTPLEKGFGIVTPSGLHYEVHHNGCPDIEPGTHELLIHGLSKQKRIFTLQDLMRFPSVTRFHFLECAGNTWSEFKKPSGKTVGATHGLTSCSEWTGVPLSSVLKEVGVRGDARWILAEGGDGAGLMRSIPIEKALDDAVLVYAQNGEMLRPEQGYPLRLLVPGYEGNMNVKWLRRLELGDKAWWTRSEVTEYADPMFDHKTGVFSFAMEVKSVITSPSAGMQLEDAGFREITGLAWSGLGCVAKVEVSTDGGGSWRQASLDGPLHPKCHTRFRLPWVWDGKRAVLQSRATDETGAVQPTLSTLHERQPSGPNHVNHIQSWQVGPDGTVSNVHHV